MTESKADHHRRRRAARPGGASSMALVLALATAASAADGRRYAERPPPTPAAKPAPTRSPVGSLACPDACPAIAWESRAPVIALSLSLQGVEGAAAGAIDGSIYVSHGYSLAADTIALRIYDIAADLWSLGPDAPVAAAARSEGSGAVLDGKFHSLGGRGFPVHEQFDPATGAWITRRIMPTGRKGMAVAVIGGQLHVVGGSTDGFGPNDGTPLDVHEVYDPASNTWSTAAPLPVALSDIYASESVGTRMFVFGGYTGSAVVDTVHIYDKAADTWSTGAPMPTARSNAVSGVMCGNIFVIGGLASPAPTAAPIDTVEVYDPLLDSWCDGPPKPTPTAETATGMVSTGDAIYAIGSGPGGATLDVHERLVRLDTCVTSALVPVTLLKAVRSGDDAIFQWTPDFGSSEYHLNAVTMKGMIRDPLIKRPPLGTPLEECTSSLTTCVGASKVFDDPPQLYYQLLPACGSSGDDEGPL